MKTMKEFENMNNCETGEEKMGNSAVAAAAAAELSDDELDDVAGGLALDDVKLVFKGDTGELCTVCKRSTSFYCFEAYKDGKKCRFKKCCKCMGLQQMEYMG